MLNAKKTVDEISTATSVARRIFDAAAIAVPSEIHRDH